MLILADTGNVLYPSSLDFFCSQPYHHQAHAFSIWSHWPRNFSVPQIREDPCRLERQSSSPNFYRPSPPRARLLSVPSRMALCRIDDASRRVTLRPRRSSLCKRRRTMVRPAEFRATEICSLRPIDPKFVKRTTQSPIVHTNWLSKWKHWIFKN